MHVYFIFSILCNHMFTIFDPYLLLGGVTFNILNKKNHRNTLFPVKIWSFVTSQWTIYWLITKKNTHKLKRNDILNWSFIHSYFQVNPCSGKSHVMKVPVYQFAIALAFLWSSSFCLTSALTILGLSAPDPIVHCWKYDIPTHCYCRKCLCLQWCLVCETISTWSSDVFADHVFLVLVWNPALVTLSSPESPRSHFAASDSSTTEFWRLLNRWKSKILKEFFACIFIDQLYKRNTLRKRQ